ncbi:hypothetical protein KIPB_016778, partial [Kipferlia bialata]|eukprot:g16778.t1
MGSPVCGVVEEEEDAIERESVVSHKGLVAILNAGVAEGVDVSAGGGLDVHVLDCLSQRHICDWTFEDCHFTSLEGATLRSVRFTNCHFSDATLEGARLVSCVFTNCNLTDASFKDGVLTGVTFKGDCTLMGVSFEEATLSDIALNHLPLEGIVFEGAQLSSVDFTDCDGSDAVLTDLDLTTCTVPGYVVHDA